MRILRLLFILCIYSVNAQNLKPACQVGATWNYIGFTGGTGTIKTSLHTFHCIKDTLIGNNMVSVIESDSNDFDFMRYSYLAKDDSDGLYFFTLPYPDLNYDTLFITYHFKEDSASNEKLFIASKTGSSNLINIQEMNCTKTLKKKVYSTNDSIDVFIKRFNNSFNLDHNKMHPKYLSLYYGTSHTPFFGTLDFSNSFDSYSMALNCYTDSNGTTKFIKEYSTFGCDYLGLKDILETKELISVFPNPCTDKFFISESINSTVNHIVVTNLLGEKIMETKVKAAFKQQGIDVSKWESGIYFVNLRGNQINATQKLIVHR